MTRRRIAILFGLSLLVSGRVWATSYVDIYGVVHDPIQDIYGDEHGYSGDNLEPGADLVEADLEWADLPNANLSQADLADAYMVEANLSGANLSFANLTWADLEEADLTDADLSSANLTDLWSLGDVSGADLSNSILFGAELDFATNWSDATWTGAKYSLNAVDNDGNPIYDTAFPAGMNQAWRDAAGMVAVPEPTTAVLVGLGLIGLGVRKRAS